MKYLVLLLSCLSVHAAQITLGFTWKPSVQETAGLTMNDYSTNIVFVFLSTTDVTQPTNTWPAFATIAATSFTNQNPIGLLWTNQFVADGSSRFYAIVVSNVTSGGTSPFSNLAPWFQPSVPGIIKSIHSP